MRRDQLEHALRAAADITGEVTILVIGSQSILGTYDEDELPAEATRSREVDLGFFNDPGGAKADLVEGAIGEDSDFDRTYDFFVDGVDAPTRPKQGDRRGNATGDHVRRFVSEGGREPPRPASPLETGMHARKHASPKHRVK